MTFPPPQVISELLLFSTEVVLNLDIRYNPFCNKENELLYKAKKIISFGNLVSTIFRSLFLD